MIQKKNLIQEAIRSALLDTEEKASKEKVYIEALLGSTGAQKQVKEQIQAALQGERPQAPLKAAIQEGSLAKVAALIKAGAQFDSETLAFAITYSSNKIDEDINIIKYLLNLNPDLINKPYFGFKPLKIAVKRDCQFSQFSTRNEPGIYMTIVKFLISKGADPEDSLEYAEHSNCSPALIKLLKEYQKTRSSTHEPKYIYGDKNNY